MNSEAVPGVRIQLEFTVTDSGIGISEEMKSRLFQPFAQGEASTSRRYGGTGLGLTLSRELAGAIGGSLTLGRSEPGQGSTFVLR